MRRPGRSLKATSRSTRKPANYSDDLTAVLQNCAGEMTHKPNAGTAVHKADAPVHQSLCQAAG